MPQGTRVHRCVESIKKKGGSANPYAVCQASTGQSYATGRTMKKAKYNSKLMSPKGDFVLYEESELHRAFPRPIKQIGKVPVPSKALSFTREKMVGDAPGLSVRKAEKDEVV